MNPNINPNSLPQSSGGAVRDGAIDGLQAYMRAIYNTMAGGLALTGIVAWLSFSQGLYQHIARVAEIDDDDMLAGDIRRGFAVHAGVELHDGAETRPHYPGGGETVRARGVMDAQRRCFDHAKYPVLTCRVAAGRWFQTVVSFATLPYSACAAATWELTGAGTTSRRCTGFAMPLRSSASATEPTLGIRAR